MIACPHRSTAQRELAKVRKCCGEMGYPMLQLRHVAGEFLSQRERCLVLQVGSSYLTIGMNFLDFAASISRSLCTAGLSSFSIAMTA